ncbi:C6 transcription factor [Apiospora hydei]|uniref:C6 transcription factor n=1 Tax=Apiospora hydei TaxID=1337664 RepID=A0ABR1UVK6_9PEZI
MRLGKTPISCTPCAKRKVRCDRLQPCCHCKRRPQDNCVYPEPAAESTPERLPNDVSDRIGKLERYIRSLGGDPEEAVRPDTRAIETSGLVTHNEEVTYIESPMWYSWSGASHSDELQNTSTGTGQSSPAVKSASWVRTILDPRESTDTSGLAWAVPLPSSHIFIFWKTFLKNVDPLVKIFFRWEVEPIIQKTHNDASSLCNEERAIVLAIVFISVSSLSGDECTKLLHDGKPQLMERYQNAAECALLLADYASTTHRLTLQAFMLYLLTMNCIARPPAMFALMGIATRIAERMGLHRDGDLLGLGVLRSEERRRMWWQLQFLEIAVARHVGSIPLSLFAGWDTKLPSNLEDADLAPDTKALPPGRRKLTGMSHCLWRYDILHAQREMRRAHDGDRGLTWLLSPRVPLADKDALLDEVETMLGTKYVRHCELLNPLHVLIQLGIGSYLLAARRTARQPALVNAKLSEMSRQERDDMLDICTKLMDYSIMARTTESIKGFLWHDDNYFQWIGFVYVLLECHHRFDQPEVVDLWDLVRRLHDVHPQLRTAIDRHEVASVARITIAAWQKYAAHAQQQQQQDETFEHPQWVLELCRNFGFSPVAEVAPTASVAVVSTEGQEQEDGNQFAGIDFDLDMFDWSIWEELNKNAGPLSTTMANITDVPPELDLIIEQLLDHPFLFNGNALATSCEPLWEKLGGTDVYRRAAEADRDRTRRAELICQDIFEGDYGWDSTEEKKKELAWLFQVARRGMGAQRASQIGWAFENATSIGKLFLDENWKPHTDPAKIQHKLESLTSKTFLNKAIVHCTDLEKLEQIIDAYVAVFPAAFTGACYGPLLELVPIHAAVYAKRLDVVQMLVSKGLAPAFVDSFFTYGQVEVRWDDDSRMFEASPFNVALSERDEDMCLALLDGADGPLCEVKEEDDDDDDDDDDDGYESDLSYDDFEERDRSEDVKLARYLKIAEANKMYRLIPALLQYWKWVCPAYQYSLRRILDLVSMNNGKDDPEWVTATARDGDGKQHIIHELALSFAVERAYWENAVIIYQYQARKGSVDSDDLAGVLVKAADHPYSGEGFFIRMWPECKQWLCKSASSAEENAQRVERCMRRCLEATIEIETTWGWNHWYPPQKSSREVSFHLLKAGVKPELCHLRAAIKAWDHDMLSELIARGDLDLRAKWSGFSDDDDKEELTPFEYALRRWYSVAGPARTRASPRPSMTLLLKLLYHAGVPEEVSEEARKVISQLFIVDFGLASHFKWHEQGRKIQARQLPQSAWDAERLVDPKVPSMEKLTTFHLLLQKEFNPDDDEEEFPALPSSKLPPYFPATKQQEQNRPPGYN